MQRPPPQDRIMDDRQVDGADKAEESREPALPAALLLGSRKRDIAEIKEEQDQHGGQAPVPFPPGSPSRTAPDRSSQQTDRRESSTCRGECAAGNRSKRMPPDELRDGSSGNARPARHAEPGCRHV